MVDTKVMGTGKVKVTFKLSDIKNATMHDVLHVPKLVGNLFSLGAAVKKGNTVTFRKSCFYIGGKDGTPGTQRVDGLYQLDAEGSSFVCHSASVATSQSVAPASAQERTWLRRLLSDLGVEVMPKVILEANQGAIAMNLVDHSRTNHIDIRYHYVRECVQNGQIELQYCPTNDMKADILTKPQPKEKFEYPRAEIGLFPF